MVRLCQGHTQVLISINSKQIIRSHHKSPSLEERKTHLSLGSGQLWTTSARAFPTSPVPPVTRITSEVSPLDPPVMEDAGRSVAKGTSISAHKFFTRCRRSLPLKEGRGLLLNQLCFAVERQSRDECLVQCSVDSPTHIFHMVIRQVSKLVS